VSLLSFDAGKYKPNDLKVFSGNPGNTVFCQKNRYARKERAQASEFPGVLEKN